MFSLSLKSKHTGTKCQSKFIEKAILFLQEKQCKFYILVVLNVSHNIKHVSARIQYVLACIKHEPARIQQVLTRIRHVSTRLRHLKRSIPIRNKIFTDSKETNLIVLNHLQQVRIWAFTILTRAPLGWVHETRLYCFIFKHL